MGACVIGFAKNMEALLSSVGKCQFEFPALTFYCIDGQSKGIQS